MDVTLFRVDLEHLLKRHGREGKSNTPDFILATYLSNCLLAFADAVNQREKWYGREAADAPR